MQLLAQAQVTNLVADLAAAGGTNITSNTVAYAATVTPAVDTKDTNIYNIGALTGNITLANPTGTPHDGQNILFCMSQDGTGGRTYTFGSAYAFGTDIPAALLPADASAKFELCVKYNSGTSKWRAIGLVRGF